ncbi:hypothetical protein BP5796_03059 [Coleophoma crateriformis]|uniref:Cupin type-1 domain-containing protein n=1 Tax=Coleophoma crateriformis TaxID=565419 RepID=A0A3D8SM17_9HELO|nr:hypothetical protein BP5796_03059 [Coleophoma crateriformis]
MIPGTTVPPHFHTRFAETFDLISGSMLVYSSTSPDLDTPDASAQQQKIGEEVTVQPRIYHKYVAGDEPTVLRAIVMPGDGDFERLLMILNGMDADGELRKMGDSVVLMGLSDAHLIGPAREMLEKVLPENKDEVEALKKGHIDNRLRFCRLDPRSSPILPYHEQRLRVSSRLLVSFSTGAPSHLDHAQTFKA